MPVPPYVIEEIKKDTRKNGVRKSTLILVVIFVLMVLFHYLVFDVIVPKTAAFTTPQKWKMIPLRQTKEIVHDYFGEPVAGTKADGSESWPAGSKEKNVLPEDLLCIRYYRIRV